MCEGTFSHHKIINLWKLDHNMPSSDYKSSAFAGATSLFYVKFNHPRYGKFNRTAIDDSGLRFVLLPLPIFHWNLVEIVGLLKEKIIFTSHGYFDGKSEKRIRKWLTKSSF